MAITRSPYGTTAAGVPVEKLTMTNHAGASVSLITYGGTLLSIVVPDRNGTLADVCLGLASLADYERTGGYLGALVGRYANRIARGNLTVAGKTYQLACNEGANHLHGGTSGFDKKVWAVDACQTREDGDSVTLTCQSPDGEENYPGTLAVSVTYCWNDQNELSLHYHAVSDAETAINLTNHAYFNLAGHGAGSVENHQIALASDTYTPVDAASLPTGELAPVAGTPFDLQSLRRIGDGLAQQSANQQLTYGQGYDHNFVLNASSEGISKACELYDPSSARVMEVFTDLPGIQFYSGNMLQVAQPAKDGAQYTKRCGLCLETQFYPDTPNQPDFPTCIFAAGEAYDHTTVYKFSVREE